MKIWNRILRDQNYRKALTSRSSYWFAHVYFAKYITYDTADFHRDIFALIDDPTKELVEVLAFRGSAKSTDITLIAPIFWMIAQEARYEVFIGDTFPQAKQYIYNVKSELETNQLLIKDWGPFKPAINEDEWQKTSIVIPKYGTRMSAHSAGQNIRGLRQLEKRPDRVICDDLENLKSVRKKENRDKLYDWWKTDVLNVGDKGTRFFLLGNLLHSDGLMKRIEKEITSGKLTGTFRKYAIAKRNGEPMWPGKFGDKAGLERERRRINNSKTWRRECLLKIVPEDGQVIREEWIKRFRVIPDEAQTTARGCGVDLAISQKATADCTAMVPGTAAMLADKPKIYVTDDIINERLGFHNTIERAKSKQQSEDGMSFFVEAVGYQLAAIETMQANWINVHPVKPMGDKRARLETVAKYVQDGTVEFQEGSMCDDLITQLLGFGVEAHDDMVDAFVYLILGLVKNSITTSEVIWL